MTTPSKSTLTPFLTTAHPVRTAPIHDEPWFVLTDLCKILGIVLALPPCLSASTMGYARRTPSSTPSALTSRPLSSTSPACTGSCFAATSPRRWPSRPDHRTRFLPSIRRHGCTPPTTSSTGCSPTPSR